MEMDDRAILIEPTEDELRQGVARALAKCGYSYAELAERHRRGSFETLDARLTWMAVGPLADLVVDDQ